MLSVAQYIANPCGTLSIPFWKSKNIQLSANMKILHDSNYNEQYSQFYNDETFFRLFHSLENISVNIPEGFFIETAKTDDINAIVSITNQSYSDLFVTEEQMTGYLNTPVYDSDLWILVYDKNTDTPVGCGIADFDRETKEGILEWIQVLPSYRGKKIGQSIVNELLYRMASKASFATVSGKVSNKTKPEILYRKCGFQGNDIWHIMYAK